MSIEEWRALRFIHVATRYRGADEADCRCGDTLWAVPGPKGTTKIGLAWEWVESEPGSGLYFASVQDLMSNAVLVDSSGGEVHARQLAAELLRCVESLPWRPLVAANISSAAH